MRRKVAGMLGKKTQASLDIFLEVVHMEVKLKLAFAAACCWARSRLED